MLENQSFERKREYNQKAQNTMLAFLNTDGGTLHIGISDDGILYGAEGDIDLEARKITTSFRDSVTPDPSGYFKVEPEKRIVELTQDELRDICSGKTSAPESDRTPHLNVVVYPDNKESQMEMKMNEIEVFNYKRESFARRYGVLQPDGSRKK